MDKVRNIGKSKKYGDPMIKLYPIPELELKLALVFHCPCRFVYL